jgi:hypothetical protein
MSKLALVNGRPKMTAEAASPTIYDETYTLVSNISTGTPITLPNSGTYTSEELEVRLNGIRMDSGIDYNFVGSPPRTQISFTFDLLGGSNPDVINFRAIWLGSLTTDNLRLMII